MDSRLEQRSELHLLHLIEMERSRRFAPTPPPWRRARTYTGDAEQAQRRARETFRFSVEALTTIGALPKPREESSIASFDAEVRSKERWPKVAPDPTTEERARRLLEALLPASGLDPESDAYGKAIWRFQQAQAAIRISGALSVEEQTRWAERLLERVVEKDQEKLRDPPACRGVDLLRVVVAPPVRHDGLTITHAELYGDGVVVHWHESITFEKPPGRELTPFESFQASKPRTGFAMLGLSDDAGTHYRWWPGPAHDSAHRGDGFVHWASATFTPAVPPEATRLIVSKEGTTYDISLAS